MQNHYTLTSHEWEKERASLNEHIQQLKRELDAFRMDSDDEDHGSDGGDA